MTRLRFLTAGESHGRQLTAVLEGCPAGLAVSAARVDEDLARRQGGYGRGARQMIESDRAEILGGVRYGRTTGAPIALTVANRDAGNWGDLLAVEAPEDPGTVAEPVRVPRPGHADLGGALLYDLHDIRDVIERASARETAARVACGAVARLLLEAVGCRVVSHVVAVGADRAAAAPLRLDDVARVEADPLRCADAAASARMRAAVDAAQEAGDTLGGVVEVLAFGYPPGVGTYVQGDRRLESVLAAAVFTVPAIKGVEFGLGFAAAGLPGSEVHDVLGHDAELGYVRRTGNAGGIEGGISSGDTIVVRAAMKPIATLRSPLRSVDMDTHRAVESRFERSDVCAVPAAGVVLERFGGATVAELCAAVDAYRAHCLSR